ncbi:MAG: Gfo/Idh/MocA family oxidoreductase [Bacteroidales bacterium]
MEDRKNAMNEKNELNEKNTLPRRTLLKALAGIPILGLFSFEAFRKLNHDKEKRSRVIRELGLEDLKAPRMVTTSPGNGQLIRLGFIGFGSRAGQLSQSLGFLHPDEVLKKERAGTLQEWLQQEDLNVAITGVCDVFDLHAQQGIATANSEIRPGGGTRQQLPVKRYTTYQDLLNDPEIDAVIVATPDHHHARITCDAIKAGKHVYCEKSICRTEEELYEVYDTVRNSDRVFQLGHQITQNVVFQQAKEIIKRDILGKITLVETTTNRNTAEGAWIRHLDSDGNPKPGDESTIDWQQWLGSRPYKPFSTDRFYNWTKWFDYDMGMIGQLFTHEFDAVNQLLRIGIPASAVASGGIYYWKDNREIPDVLHAVFEYPEKELTLTYSANLASSRQRGRVFNGHDASMELGGSLSITADWDSTQYRKQLDQGIIDVSVPMITISPSTGGDVDAVTSATEKYYASRGLTTTNINGREVDVTHLHIKEWIDCIRTGGETSANIERAFEEGVACVMANKSYLEKRRVEWDPWNRRIV